MLKRYRKVGFIILIIGAIVLSGCGPNNGIGSGGDEMEEKTGYLDISPETAKERLDSDEEVILLDVRTQEEYKDSHIPDSVLIPLDTLESEAPELLTDKDIPIFVYCRSGNRSVAASEILVELGYTNVYNLGGINDWPYEVVNP